MPYDKSLDIMQFNIVKNNNNNNNNINNKKEL